MQRNILTVLIPSYNYFEGVERIVDMLAAHRGVGVIVGDDSDDVSVAYRLKKFIEDIDRPDFLYFKHESTKNAVDNWNFLLRKVDTKFFVLVHHDERFENTFFIDHLYEHQQDIELLVLPLRVEHPDKLIRKVTTLLQRTLIRLFKRSGPTINFIGGPSALLVVDKKHLTYFNRDLVFFVDVDWYYRIFSNVSKKSISYYSKTLVNSLILEGSITSKNAPRQREIVKADLEILNKVYPHRTSVSSTVWRLFMHALFKTTLLPSFIPFYFRKLKHALIAKWKTR